MVLSAELLRELAEQARLPLAADELEQVQLDLDAVLVWAAELPERPPPLADAPPWEGVDAP